MMTKKDFIMLADYIRRDYEHGNNLLEPLLAFCKAQNHAFMPGRFLGYLKNECGPHGGKIK